MKTVAIVALLLTAALSGCSSAASLPPVHAADPTPESTSSAATSESECATVVGAVAPIPSQPGMFFLVSQDLAHSLEACASVAEWEGALIAHPEVISAESVSAEEAQQYLLNACGYDGDGARPSQPCVEAKAAGLSF